MKVHLNPPPETSLPDPVTHFVDSVNNLFDHVLENVDDADMVGITIHNEVNLSDKPIGFSFRRTDQLSPDVIWSVFDKLSQSNARFNVTDTDRDGSFPQCLQDSVGTVLKERADRSRPWLI